MGSHGKQVRVRPHYRNGRPVRGHLRRRPKPRLQLGLGGIALIVIGLALLAVWGASLG